jgi:pimeloyl-ACP methyl ester carboxylesterase
VLRALEVPLLVTQDRTDTVVLSTMAEHILSTCPTAEASWYDGVGHMPHLEGARAIQPRARRADPARSCLISVRRQ